MATHLAAAPPPSVPAGLADVTMDSLEAMGDAALEETDQVDAEIRALMARKSVLGRQKKIKGQRRQRLQEKLRGYNPVEDAWNRI